MNWFSKKTSGWPLFAIGLILISLWGTILVKDFEEVKEVPKGHEQAFYGDVLPNFLAPVIREEVRKEPSDEQENGRVNLPIKGLSHLIKVIIKQ